MTVEDMRNALYVATDLLPELVAVASDETVLWAYQWWFGPAD